MMLDVICPGCGGRFHETNDKTKYFRKNGLGGPIKDPRAHKFESDKPCNGAMLHLKEKYIKWGWTDFPHDTWIMGDQLECPSCGTSYVDSDGFVTVGPQKIEVQSCSHEVA